MFADCDALSKYVREAASTAQVIRLRPARSARRANLTPALAPTPSLLAPWSFDDDAPVVSGRERARPTPRLFSAGCLEF